MVTIPPRHYVVVGNPVLRNDSGEILFTGDGAHRQVKLSHADREIRLSQDPFPLYPGEEIVKNITPLTVVPADTALRLRAVLDVTDADVGPKSAGDEWLYEGPGTYIPCKEVTVVDTIRATIIAPNQALQLRARKDTVDRDGKKRVTGEEWLVERIGAYMPGVYEEVIGHVNAIVLTDTVALHLKATQRFKDCFGNTRKAGEEWLVTQKDCDTYIPGVFEKAVENVTITSLTNRQYCVICDPINEEGQNQLGMRLLRKGPDSFFLKPGESIPDGIQAFFVLSESDALVIVANEAFVEHGSDRTEIARSPGDRWMVRGPTEYIPPVEVTVLEQRTATPLDQNEGIYVRNVQTGSVRCVAGETYLLNENEELWEKELPYNVEKLLSVSHFVDARSERTAEAQANRDQMHVKKRDKSRAITYQVPHNAAIQIYDYKRKAARVVFGPELVMLEPDEEFTQLSLSGGKPKKPNTIKCLCLLLGPDFCTDIITVETADHARLQLQLSYNWHFEYDSTNQSEAAKLFSVADFVGDLCKAVASRVRGWVAGVQFDDFHKNSARIIRSSVFGQTSEGKVRDQFRFPANNLVITSIDIQNVEPVDQRTRDALQKSVQLAIEITTNSQEAQARQQASRLEQEAKGKLERQRIDDEANAEASRSRLVELQAKSAAVESTGQAKAEAQSRAEAARIEGEAAVEQAKLKTEALQIEARSELDRLQAAREAELKYLAEKTEIELRKCQKEAELETAKFKSMVDAIGSDTLKAMAQAGPEMQAKLLGSLGIQSTLITDGKNPINLFQTAQGLVSNVPGMNSGEAA